MPYDLTLHSDPLSAGHPFMNDPQFLPQYFSPPHSPLCSHTSIQQALQLFQGHKRIADILLEKGGGAGTKKVGGASALSNFTLQFVVKLLRALFK